MILLTVPTKSFPEKSSTPMFKVIYIIMIIKQ